MIDKNTDMSNVCIDMCKEEVREHVSSSCLNIDVEDITSVLYEPIDIDKFKAWFDRNLSTFKTKQIIQPYFKRAFLNELNKGTFKEEKIALDTTSLVNTMREKGIKVSNDDPLYLEIMWEEIFKAGIKDEVAVNLNRHVIDYMEQGQDFQMYLYYIKHNNGLRGLTIDWDKIDSEYQRQLKVWKIILNDLSLEVKLND